MSHVIWSPGMTLEDIERQVIEAAFKFYRNKTATANALGVSVKTIDNKFEKYAADDAAAKVAVEDRRRASDEYLARQRGTAPSEPVPAHTPADAITPASVGPAAASAAATPTAMAAPTAPPPRRGLDDVLGARLAPPTIAAARRGTR